MCLETVVRVYKLVGRTFQARTEKHNGYEFEIVLIENEHIFNQGHNITDFAKKRSKTNAARISVEKQSTKTWKIHFY